jgi:hypothetical protein
LDQCENKAINIHPKNNAKMYLKNKCQNIKKLTWVERNETSLSLCEYLQATIKLYKAKNGQKQKVDFS